MVRRATLGPEQEQLLTRIQADDTIGQALRAISRWGAASETIAVLDRPPGRYLLDWAADGFFLNDGRRQC